MPQQYATAMELGGGAIGLLVTSVDGRPIKIEGNPLHPASLGAASALAQASVLELYDPDRSKQVVRRESGQAFASSWDEFAAFAGPHFGSLRASGGAGLAVLAEESSSPSLARLRQRFAEVFPKAVWCEHEPISRTNETAGMAMLSDPPLRPVYRFDKADVVVCLDADPLLDHPAALRHARDFASRRRAEDGTMVRLYAAEPAVSVTGAAADHRLAIPAHRVEGLARQLVAAVTRAGVRVPGFAGEAAADAPATGAAAWVASAAADLLAHRGRCVVVAGRRQAPAAHAIAHALNVALGSAGGPVVYVAPEASRQGAGQPSLRDFARRVGEGAYATLVILGGNPAYTAPVDLDLGGAISKVATSIHLSLFDDETSRLCRWHLPRAHYLETWGDVRAWDGTVSVQQPLIDALYGGKSVIETMALIFGDRETGGYGIARGTLAGTTKALDFESVWRRTLNDGVLAESAFAAVAPAFKPVDLRPQPGSSGATEPAAGLELVFVADAKTVDGRFANNAWLQEMPDPLTKVTWDNPALLSPATAAGLGVRHGDVVRLTRAGRTLEIAVYVMPGQADDTVVLPLGYGRTAAGKVGTGVGFDTYALRTSDALEFALGAKLERTGRTYALACTQNQQGIDRVGYEARGQRVAELLREGTLGGYKADPEFVRKMDEAPVLPIFQSPPLTGEHQWGMSIDLSACIGCNACMVACQAENNIAVVGKDQVIRGRAMHWIRVDRYFSGKPQTPKIAFQPVACQHCENAPCEEVCPVAATVHSDEGVNEQVYNRCVGTRYCSNNCPYKVRRFNFYNWFKNAPETEKMVFNPEVTVRGRGVMEKCSFCIQRIEAVKISAKNDRRPIRDGEIVPACAQTCPTQAIVFGDLKDPESRVTKLHRHRRAYSLLGELNTKPRNRYLAKLRNPSPDGGDES